VEGWGRLYMLPSKGWALYSTIEVPSLANQTGLRVQSEEKAWTSQPERGNYKMAVDAVASCMLCCYGI